MHTKGSAFLARRDLVVRDIGEARWEALRLRVMGLDHSWAASARRYVEMYEAARGTRRDS